MHLRLYANTAEVNGQSFPLPLSDIFMGGILLAMPTNHTLADDNSAEFMGPGSARGVDLIARGTAQNPNLSVTPHFRAYVRQGDSDVAQLQPIELPAFEHAIETQAIVADIERPYNVTMNPFEALATGQLVSLSGVPLDEQGVTRIDTYEGSTLVASTEMQQTPNSITTDETGTWSAPWLARTGTHQLTAVARDAAGNESEAAQPVTVADKQQREGLYYNPWQGSYVQNVTLAPGESQWIEVDAAQSYGSGYWYFGATDNTNDEGRLTPLSLEVFGGPDGNSLNGETFYTFNSEWGIQRYITSGTRTHFWVKLTNLGTSAWNFNFDSGYTWPD